MSEQAPPRILIILGVIGAHKQAKGEYGTARVKIEYLQEALEHEIEQFTGQSQQHQSY